MPASLDITFDLTGAILAALGPAVNAVVTESAERLRDRAKDKIEGGPKSGHVYTSGPAPLPHQASAPGESPANWTDALKDSITAEPIGPMAAEVRVGSPYGLALEFGSSDGRVAARPFFLPAVEEEREEFMATMAGAVEAAMGRG